MSRYFIEVSYKGAAYGGFQVQENAMTVQGAVEKAMGIFFRREIMLTGSSRTDTGVHAKQNYFHFDSDGEMDERWVYNLNALLPGDIAIRNIRRVADGAHCRFDAVWREYSYLVYRFKDPFISDAGYYYPYALEKEEMKRSAEVLKEYSMFGSFAKRNSQVKTFACRIMESEWMEEEGNMRYQVRANRFLRGMVRGLVGTMLQVGRGKISVEEFRDIIEGGDSSRVDFSVPGHGLCLEKVGYPAGYFG